MIKVIFDALPRRDAPGGRGNCPGWLNMEHHTDPMRAIVAHELFSLRDRVQNFSGAVDILSLTMTDIM
jgi:hypothetical protein